MTWRSMCLWLVLVAVSGHVRAQYHAPNLNTQVSFDEVIQSHIRPFLAKHCFDCHGSEKPKGDLRLDRLSADLSDAAAREAWTAVVERLEAGEMPPKEKPRPAEQDVKQVLLVIKPPLAAAIASDRARQGRTVLRRLNRVEYQNTIRDLLGIQLNLKDLLPQDSSANGFDNSGAALHTSSFLMEKYLDAADAALNAAIANSPQPPLVKKRLFCQNQRHVKVTTEKVYLPREDGLVFFSSSAWHAVTMDEFYPPDRGAYRFRISAQAVNSAGKPVTFEVKAGPMLMGTKNHLVSYFDAPRRYAADFRIRRSLRGPRSHSHPSARTCLGSGGQQGRGRQVRWSRTGGRVGRVRRAALRPLAAREPSPHLRRSAAGPGADLQQAEACRSRFQ